MKLALAKIGILDRDKRNYKENLGLHHTIFDKKKKELLEEKGFPEGWNKDVKAFVRFSDFGSTRDVLTEIIREYVEEQETIQKSIRDWREKKRQKKKRTGINHR